jgi:adenosylmethionine-8-amino-7-oxononanoate aminotransferase
MEKKKVNTIAEIENKVNTVNIRDKQFLWHGWAKAKQEHLIISHGEGYYVWDFHGRCYIDATASAMNSICGYAHPNLIAAAHEQLLRLPHFDLSSGGNEPAVDLAEKLANLLPGSLKRTTFANSGSEATEAAIKIIHDYWTIVGESRKRIITFAKGYHGTTMLCQGLTDIVSSHMNSILRFPVTPIPFMMTAKELRKPSALQCLLETFECAFKDIAQYKGVAAVLVEPLLNVGGGIVLPSGFLRGLREICDRYNTLLCIDEVFTGFGRTGELFCFEHEGIIPDLVTFSKGISSGYIPLSAVTVAEHIYSAFKDNSISNDLKYGHTTSGHAVACRVACETIDVIQTEGLVENAALLGKLILDGISSFRMPGCVVDIRGLGMINIVETNSVNTAQSLCMAAREEGLLVRIQETSVVIVPPLMLDKIGVEEIVSKFTQALKKIDL